MRFFRLQNAASALVVLGITVGLAVIQIPMSTSANAQAISTNGGSIQGTIADPTGAAIPGAPEKAACQKGGEESRRRSEIELE